MADFMTMLYKMFGIPGTIEEFAEKARDSGIRNVRIYGVRGARDSDVPATSMNIAVGDDSEKISYEEKVYSESNFPGVLADVTRAEEYMRKAGEWKRILENSGIISEIEFRMNGHGIALTEAAEKDVAERCARARSLVEEAGRILESYKFFK